LPEALKTASPIDDAVVRLALASVLEKAGRAPEALAEVDRALSVVAGGRAPMLELQGLRLKQSLGDAGLKGPDLDREIQSLMDSLGSNLPESLGKLQTAWPVFPLP
jgi:hypothetical protein